MRKFGQTRRPVKLPIPTWVATVYGLFCVVLVPWTIYLSATLPEHQVVDHYDASWVGLDIGIILSLLATATLAARRSQWVVVAATMTSSFLLVDAWFDVTSARKGLHFEQALLLAIFIELPVAIMSFGVAYHVLRRNIR